MHKQVVNHLFVMLVTSVHDEGAIGPEFYRCYRHLVEGRPLSELPLTLADREEFLAFFHAIKASVSDDDPDFTQATDRISSTARGDHGEHDGDGDDGRDPDDGDDDGERDEG